jgi:hypothetical protein
MMGHDVVPTEFSTKKHKTIARSAERTTWVKNACQKFTSMEACPESRRAPVTNLAMSRRQRGEKSVEATLFNHSLEQCFHMDAVRATASCHAFLLSRFSDF